MAFADAIGGVSGSTVSSRTRAFVIATPTRTRRRTADRAWFLSTLPMRENAEPPTTCNTLANNRATIVSLPPGGLLDTDRAPIHTAMPTPATTRRIGSTRGDRYRPSRSGRDRRGRWTNTSRLSHSAHAQASCHWRTGAAHRVADPFPVILVLVEPLEATDGGHDIPQSV